MACSAAVSATIVEGDERHYHKGGPALAQRSYSLLSEEARHKDGPAALQTIFRLLEARGPKESMNLLRDVLESMKLVQAITGTGAAASFVHANAYDDSRGEAFGVLTALSTILAFLSLVVTVIIYVSLGFLEHDDLRAVEGYLLRYWGAIACIIFGSVLSMILLVAAVVVDAFRAYSRQSAVCLLATTLIGLVCIVVFWISSSRYIFDTSTADVPAVACEEPEFGSEADLILNGEGEMTETSSLMTEQSMQNRVFSLSCH